MGNREKRRAKIEARKAENNKTTYQPADATIEDNVVITSTESGKMLSDSSEVIRMKCVARNISLTPDRIIYGETYFRDKSVEFHGNRLGSAYGMFFTDSLLTSYVGFKELDCMEEV